MPHVTEITRDGVAYQTAETIQAQTALLPDYTFKESTSILGTSVSGIVGCLFVFGLCLAGCYALRLYRKKVSHTTHAERAYSHE